MNINMTSKTIINIARAVLAINKKKPCCSGFILYFNVNIYLKLTDILHAKYALNTDLKKSIFSQLISKIFFNDDYLL